MLCLCLLSFSFSSVFVALSSFGSVVHSRTDPQLSLNSFLDHCSCGSFAVLRRELLIFTCCHIHILDPISRASRTCQTFIYIQYVSNIFYSYTFRVCNSHIHVYISSVYLYISYIYIYIYIYISHIQISRTYISHTNFTYIHFACKYFACKFCI